MNSTYCGKNCEACEYREKLQCKGCKNGPGRELYGDCDVASCCREHSLKQCAECISRTGCEKYNSASRKAYLRSVQFGSEEEQNEEKKERSQNLGKKVRIIFILSILQTIFSILSLIEKIPVLYCIGTIGTIVIGIIYAIVLLLMAQESDRFKASGICYMMVALGSIVTGVFIKGVLGALLALVVFILSCVALYQEIYGYSDTLSGISDTLSMKWCEIWKNLLICYIVIQVSRIILVALLPILAILGMIGGCIGLIVVEIMRLICLNDTARAFDTYAESYE
jgi:hypothetical protein